MKWSRDECEFIGCDELMVALHSCIGVVLNNPRFIIQYVDSLPVMSCLHRHQ